VSILRRPASALLVVAVAAALVACGSSPSKPDDVPSMAQVRALLQRHSQAVLSRSSAAFLVDVDTSSRAAAFRERQAAEIGALRDVPLASWEYDVDAQVNDPAATSAAAARYETPALLVRVAVSFRLNGIDATPSTHELYWTFVRRSGHTLLAGDDDLAASAGASWRGPWDFGRISVARGAASLVLGHPDSASSLPAIASAVDDAVPAVTAVIGTDWPGKVAVFVPSSAAEFAALSGGVSSTDISAVTVFDDPGQTRLARVVVRPNVLKTLSPTGLQIVLRHEITHVATATTTSPITPRWMIEGLAEYVGNLGSGQPIAQAASELATAVRSGAVPTRLPLDSDFSGTGTAVERVYEQSWLACRYLASRLRPAGLVALYVAVGRSSAPDDTAFGVELKGALGMSVPQFVAAWQTYLRTELG
jgi:hypothetical protein